MIQRRDFLRQGLLLLAGTALPTGLGATLSGEALLSARPELRWGFLVDTRKCVGCGFCVKACKLENDIPFDANVSRTWVERYRIANDGRMHIDSPKAGRDGFGPPSAPAAGETSADPIADRDLAQAFFVPKLCNQCEHPACVQVCPVGATYQTADGVVLVDRRWCIGCGYCIMGCPYGVRFFHPVHKVADKCNFCYHRIHRQSTTACVAACPFGARQIGNLKDANDPVTRTIRTARVGVLKEEYGTKPQVYYLELSREVR